MTRALVLSEHDLAGWRERHGRGEVPAPMPYGVDALEEVGWSLHGARRAVDPRWSRLRDVVEHRAGYPVEQTLRGAREAQRSDVVLALLERQGAAASLSEVGYELGGAVGTAVLGTVLAGVQGVRESGGAGTAEAFRSGAGAAGVAALVAAGLMIVLVRRRLTGYRIR